MSEKRVRPSMFGVEDGKAVIKTELGIVEVYDRDVSRLMFVLYQVMDEADKDTALMLLGPREEPRSGTS